jgi:transcriptional regulator with XRE-family HTH domain
MTTWVKGGFATPAALVERIRVEVASAGSQEAAAKRLGVSAQYLCDVLKGRREPGKKLLDAIGYRRVVVYEQIR